MLPVYSSGFGWGEAEFFHEEHPVNETRRDEGLTPQRPNQRVLEHEMTLGSLTFLMADYQL